jgi:hypothetical protein
MRAILKVVCGLTIGLGITLGISASTFAALPATALRPPTASHLPAGKGTNYSGVYAGVPANGELDCNGDSPVQAPLRAFNCTDIRGFAGVDNQNTWGGRFYDNGVYIGHDEPDVTFLSDQPGSGGNVSWNLTLGSDPAAAPTGTTPGSDVSHWFELSPAPWLSMALCDPDSYPQLPCTPNSDSNAPSGSYPGGGSAFMEMQFYPPGNAPWVDSESCDNSHWCAALTLDSLECTLDYAECNTNCEEPINFSFIQTNGVPPGPPSPQDSDLASSVPNSHTLLMNEGDDVTVHIFDAPVPGEAGQHALEVLVDDLTTGRSGFMQASAKNGFQDTSMVDCSGTPYNFEPEYSTASVGNYIPWAALQTNISTEFETGHYEPCTTLSKEFKTNPIDAHDKGGVGGTSGAYDGCLGPYETAGGPEGPETGDAMCYAAGDVHTGYDGVATDKTPPDELTGCQANWFQNGDLDFDGSPYWKGEWPTSSSVTSRLPSSFVEELPDTNGQSYPRFFFQTDIALSEVNAKCGPSSPKSCTVPPDGPGHFYPYWSEADHGGTCTLEFGNVSSGVDDFGQDAQFGKVQLATLGYPEFEGPIYDNTCLPQQSEGYLLVGKSGQVVPAGDAPSLGDVHTPSGSVVGIAATPDGRGYFAVTDTGAVYTQGDAAFSGDLSTLSPAVHVSDIVAIAPTTDGRGYWLIGADGGEFAFGDAKFHGSLPGSGVNVDDVIGMVASPSGAGYLIVAADGGVFAYGASHFYGSLPALGVKVDDIRGILPAAAGTGYILVGADGGAFDFGSGVPFHGSLPDEHVTVSDIVGIALTSDDGGYWMAGSNGIVYPFGDARSLTNPLSSADLPITGITATTVDVAS